MKSHLALFFTAAIAIQVLANNNRWQLEAKRYKALNMFQRAQYDKASKLFSSNRYKAAAAEFEKFKVQFPNSQIVSHVLLMRGRSFHESRKRNQAIKIYNEVLDFFGENIGDAAPALYYKAMAHLQNGARRQGMEALKEMADDEDYRKHYLAAGAIRRLADNCWKNNEKETAVRYWKQVCRDFGKSNKHEAGIAWRNVLSYYIRSTDYESLEAWVLLGRGEVDKCKIINGLHQIAQDGFSHHWHKHYGSRNNERKAAARAFAQYFLAKRKLYARVNKEWEHRSRTIEYLSRAYHDKKMVKEEFTGAIKWVDVKVTKQSERNCKFAWLIDQMRHNGLVAEAACCLSKIEGDPAFRAYKRFELLGQQKKWQETIPLLESIHKMNTKPWSKRALADLAAVYKNRLGKFNKAIEVYNQIAEPPGTLWSIQECYWRMGKRDKAHTILMEIENMFPSDAPNAAWQRAHYYRMSKDKKMAVKHARRIMKVYAKSGASSKAHQLLEDYGIATGGGVTN